MTDKTAGDAGEPSVAELQARLGEAHTALEGLSGRHINPPLLLSESPDPIERERSIGQVELFKALAQAQAEFETIQATADNEYFHSKYAPLFALWDHARPILKKHGLVLIQEPMPSTIEEGAKIRNTLAHTSGEWRSSVIVIPIDLGKEGKGKKAPAYGSAYTYARRYGMGGILGLATSAEDTDASTADPDYSTQSSAAAEGWKSWAEFMCKKMREATSRLDLEKLWAECAQKLENQEVPDIVPDLLNISYDRRKQELNEAKAKTLDDLDPDADVPQ